MQVCVVGVEGGEPWGFFNLHFSNSFLLCSPKRQHAEWSKHLTFVKCWWSGPDRRGSVRWRVGGSSKQEFKFHLFHFSVHKLEEVRRGRWQNRGSFQLRVTATTSLATSQKYSTWGGPVRRSPWGSRAKAARQGLVSGAQGSGTEAQRGY